MSIEFLDLEKRVEAYSACAQNRIRHRFKPEGKPTYLDGWVQLVCCKKCGFAKFRPALELRKGGRYVRPR